jgi:hypothetical protein
MNRTFNLFGKLTEEIDDFDNEGIYIVGRPDSKKYESKEKRGERGGYYHSQRQLLEAIDLASASKFKHGIWDEEGQRKTYLNIVNFYRDVMKMKINIDVANYLMEPTSLDYAWPVWLFDKKFKVWADDESYDDQIDEYAHDLSTYGTCVSKKAADCTVRVPLRTLRCTQSAKSLYKAAISGGYAIIESEFHYNQLTDYPDWEIGGLDKTKTYNVFERYGLVPASLLKKWRDLSDREIVNYQISPDDDMVLAMAIIVQDSGAGAAEDSLVFLEQLDEETWPLDECHVEKIDGRWIGKGEIEKQLENQLARNLNANYRRRGILWAAKKIFQTTDENVQENLVYEVLDGQVLHVKPNGTITQVNTENQHSSEITADDNAVKENSQQNAFAFEVATGEALPSGTPFRLGVVLSQAVASHFDLVRKTFSNFLKRSFFDQIIPTFEQEYREEHSVVIPFGMSDVDAFRDDIITYHVNLRVWKYVLSHTPGQPGPNVQQIKTQVEQELSRNPYAFVEAPKDFYKEARQFMRLNLVDDIAADISDLITLYQTMVQKGDPRADHVLAEIFAKRGKALPAIVGGSPTPEPTPQPMPALPTSAWPRLAAAAAKAGEAAKGPQPAAAGASA